LIFPEYTQDLISITLINPLHASNEMKLEKIKDALLASKRPLFFFDDDPDGLCSFLQLYKQLGEGKGIIIKTTPRIDMKFLRFVHGYEPDRVFILDIAHVEDEFIQAVNVPIVVIDHHEPKDYHGVDYFNPRKESIISCTSAVIYDTFKDNLWIAAIGAVADWIMPVFIEEFKEKYPDLVGELEIEKLLFESKLGQLCRVFSFNMKGKHSDVSKSMKILTRIKSPYEILNQETPAGKFVWKRFQAGERVYQGLVEDARKHADGGFLVFIYGDDRLSLSKDLANQMLHEFPDKVIIVGRKRSGSAKLSIRSKKNLPPILAESLQGVDGFGGGHEHACGCVVNEEDFDRWLDGFRKLCSK